MFENAVFQGGGVKGIALIGALKVLEAKGVRFKRVAGTSAGAIVAALYASGYRAEEMAAILTSKQLSSLAEPPFFASYALWRTFGMHDGEALLQWLSDLLKAKNVRTFSDLEEVDLTVVTTDLTRRRLVALNRETAGTLSVAEAVRASASIPFFFTPVKVAESLYVDGGVLSNFPINTVGFDPSVTLGFRLQADEERTVAPGGLLEFGTSLINTMLDAHDTFSLEHSNATVITIPVGGIARTTEFSLTEDQQKRLLDAGRTSALAYIAESGADFGYRVVRGGRISFRIEREALAHGAPVRFSISALVRVEVDGRYLLVKGNRIRHQLQPPGGVLKWAQGAQPVFRHLGIEADQKFPIDDLSRNDLRVRVPLQSIAAFVSWYESNKDRESCPWREFYEELVASEILPPAVFPHAFFTHARTVVPGMQYSENAKCWEVQVAEIFELQPDGPQLLALRATQNDQSERLRRDEFACQTAEYAWMTQDQILRKGYDVASQKVLGSVSDHSRWLVG